jgi:hypothetical protein
MVPAKHDTHNGRRTMDRPRRLRRWLVFVWIAAFLIPTVAATAQRLLLNDETPWWAANKSATGLAPDPATTPEAVLQVYAARAWGWRGALGVHTWIAAKRSKAKSYQRLEVIGWGVRRGGSAVRITTGAPDALWYGQRPELLAELRGSGVDALIDRTLTLARSYPYPGQYRVWPGPNSNTFIAHLARGLPELALDLPTTAIGKDFLPNGRWLANAPSGTGFQLSLWGLAGITVALEEGLEINLLGLGAGLDLSPPALRVPGLGRIGSSNTPRSDPSVAATLKP